MPIIEILDLGDVTTAIVESAEAAALSAEQLQISKQIASGQEIINNPFVAPSRKRISIESSNIGTELEKRKEADFQIGTVLEGVKYDSLREAAGKYWSIVEDTNKVEFVSPGLAAEPKSAKIPFSFHVLPAAYKEGQTGAFFGKVENNPFFGYEEIVLLSGDVNYFQGSGTDPWNVVHARWKDFIEGSTDGPTPGVGVLKEQEEFNYLAYSSPMPYNFNDLDKPNLVGTQYVKIAHEYNFYIKSYENAHRFGIAQNLPETWLPNLYAIALEKGNDISNTHLNRHVTVDNTLTDAAVPEFKSIKDNYGQYFEVWSRNLNRLEDFAAPMGATANDTLMGQEVVPKFKNIVVPYNTMSSLKEYSKYKEMFPMFVDIEFRTDRSTELAQALADTKLIDEFVWNLAKITTASGAEVAEGLTEVGASGEEFNFTEYNEASSVEQNDDGSTTVKKIAHTSTQKKRVWNLLEDWLDNSTVINFTDPDFIGADGPIANDAMLSRTVFLDDGTTSENLKANPNTNFLKNLMSVVFVEKLKKFIKSKFLTYEDTLNGHMCFAEDVAYRVEKSLADLEGRPTDDVIQNFWFPNSSEIDVVNFVDTQVKYDKRYAYRFYSYRLVVNTKYYYTGIPLPGNTDEVLPVVPAYNDNDLLIAHFKVVSAPEVLIIEEEILSNDSLIVDDPPIPPEVNIIPYFANGENLLLNLNSAVGEYMSDPVFLDVEDIGMYDRVRISQRATKEGDKIRFKGDDQIAAFQIYRIENRPQEWQDFDTAEIATVSNAYASTGEYLDRISSNKTYYYTFRAIDVHGHVSLPTEVYEIELVNDEGSVYLRKNVIDFYPREPRHPSKPMRRLLEIKPVAEQGFINVEVSQEESAFDIKNVKLGTRQEAPWGRKFKFRIASRKTGRKMDINIDFNVELDTLK